MKEKTLTMNEYRRVTRCPFCLSYSTRIVPISIPYIVPNKGTPYNKNDANDICDAINMASRVIKGCEDCGRMEDIEKTEALQIINFDLNTREN